MQVYQQYNPGKLGEVDNLLTKYRGNEHELYLKICKKYNVAPQAPISAQAAANPFGSGLQSFGASPFGSAASASPFGGTAQSNFGGGGAPAFGSTSPLGGTASPFGSMAPTSTPFGGGGAPAFGGGVFGGGGAPSTFTGLSGQMQSQGGFGAFGSASSPFGGSAPAASPFGGQCPAQNGFGGAPQWTQHRG